MENERGELVDRKQLPTQPGFGSALRTPPNATIVETPS